MGVPGDKIQVKYGRLYLKGKTVGRRNVKDYLIQGNFGHNRKVTQYIETLPNGKTYAILEMSDQGPLDNTGVYIVPDNHYFALGDNRDNSQDSRVHPQVGFIPKRNLVGRAEILFFSKNDNARWWEIWKWPSTIRANRFFKKII